MRVTQANNRKILDTQTDILELARLAFQATPKMPSIVEFAELPEFMGTNGRRLYPRQKTLLKLMFLETENMSQYDIDVIDGWSRNFDRSADRIGVSPDVWDRVEILKAKGLPHFREVINITGRRGGKGHLGAIVAAYQMYRLITLDNPQWHYGIAPDKDLYLYVTATNIDQARKFQFSDVLKLCRDAPCFKNYIAKDSDYNLWLRTPNDFRRIAEFESMGQRPQSIIASIRAEAISSNSGSSRGAACLSPDTPVLKGNGETVRLETVQVGDVLSSVEEYPQGPERKVLPATVLAKTITRAKTFKITFDDGTSVICSDDHRWLDDRGQWKEAKDFNVGDHIEEFQTFMERT